MSYDALVGSPQPFVCPICRRQIENDARVVCALHTEVNFIAKSDDTEEGYSFLDPDCEWYVHLDYNQEEVFHERCYALMLDDLLTDLA